MTMNAQEFVRKWRGVTLKERSAAQEHFLDLCALLNHPTPAADDPRGERFTFEAGANKTAGGQGWADVWKKSYFAWEYKGPDKDLDKAYQQLLRYRESLLNPPLLIVSDFEHIRIHTNFTNTEKKIYELSLDDLTTKAGYDTLWAAFNEPERLKSARTSENVTEDAAKRFAELAELLRKYGEAPAAVAHFLIRLLFCLFAEDIGLLPRGLFSTLVARTRRNAPAFAAQLRQLFSAMATGGWFGSDEIPYFDGGLFDDDSVLQLDSTGMDILVAVSGLDWSSVEPAVLGTLFERSLDPRKRSQLGAHYTSKDDILLIVEPVLMAPLRRRWETLQADARQLAAERDAASSPRTRNQKATELAGLLGQFMDEIGAVRVLDPACGSGNFLYVALRRLLDLQKEVATLAGDLGLPHMLVTAHPRQLFGIEINEYAAEIARTTVWIGYIQWMVENGFGWNDRPILQKLDNIQRKDAILTFLDGQPAEPDWPAAEVIIGNPPFLGGQKMLGELGKNYLDSLRHVYDGRVPGGADLVCYWFECARELIEQKRSLRAGLIATQAIRGGVNRVVLERIKQSGDIFTAYSDRDWVLDGANVHVSIIGFDDGSDKIRRLDDQPAAEIYANLAGDVATSDAELLSENKGLAFQGPVKVGPFDIPNDLAQQFIHKSGNPNGRPNSDVIFPILNASDITQNPSNRWVIDFADLPLEGAADYVLPFEYVKREVKPIRDKNNSKSRREKWWLLGASGTDYRLAKANLARVIMTPRVAKFRVFVWVDSKVVPDSAVVAIAREDDYFFGVLHSRVHEVWALRQGTALEDRPRYTPTTTFETFPFPWPPGSEPTDDPRVQAIAAAAKELNDKREAGWVEPGLAPEELKKRTLTNLYNARPTWLALLHQRLDDAVFRAYGWPEPVDDVSDEEILRRVLALNLERGRGG